MNVTRNLKNIMLALAVAGALGLSLSALAQNNPERGARLAERLDLTTEQQQEIDNLRSAHREDMQALREQRQEARMALREEIRAVLTPEQAEQFDAMEHRRAERRQGAMHGERGHRGHHGHARQRGDCARGNKA
ncbi:MAG: Spy/CpxP family protein refolding chaperone [Wenzhouxiangella sp.]